MSNIVQVSTAQNSAFMFTINAFMFTIGLWLAILACPAVPGLSLSVPGSQAVF